MAPRAKKKQTPETKEAQMNLCDPESFLPIITECLSDEQKKLMRPEHMANFMALSAELFLSNYDGIATAFEKQNGLALDFKARLAQEKDTVDISYKPVEVYKDSASLNLPDPDQETMPFMKKGSPPPPPQEQEPEAVVVEAEILELPAPKPEPLMIEGKARTQEEEDAYERGRIAASEGFAPDANPYDEDAELFQEWRTGWHARAAQMIEEAEEAQAAESAGTTKED